MNRKEATELLPIIQAYAEGKEIEIFDKTMKMWKTAMLPHFGCNPKNYRIKPGVKYRPFANVEECWTEMKKHQPFGWVINKSNGRAYNIQSVLLEEGVVYIRGSYVELEKAFIDYTFADGTPFGIKVEE